MTNTRKINVPKIPPTEYWETHNKSGTKGVKVSMPENPEDTISQKLFTPNDSANLRYALGAMSDEQFKSFMKGQEDEFLRIILEGGERC